MYEEPYILAAIFINLIVTVLFIVASVVVNFKIKRNYLDNFAKVLWLFFFLKFIAYATHAIIYVYEFP